MQHTIKDRLILLNILPKEGNILTLKVVRKLREALSFSEEELAEYKFVQDNERLSWTEPEKPTRDISVGKEGKKIIRESLEKLDKEKKLTEDHIDLYEKYVGKEDEED